MSAMAAKLSLKLLVSNDSNKVIFAEATKDFVDILFSFLTLPLGTIVRLVEKGSYIGSVTVGCLNSLYHSVENLKEECFWKETGKEMLLQPTNSSEDYCNTLKIKIDDERTKYFTCSNLDICDYPNVGISPNNYCSRCRSSFVNSIFLKHFYQGFVSSVATYLITDELIVVPNTMDNICLDVLHYFAIKGTSSVREITVNVTKEKVLDLLKCALLSNSTLTDFFLGKEPSLVKPVFFSCDVENTDNIEIKLKLFMRKTDSKILFAVGEENFADLILSFLTFPLGGVVTKLGGKCSLGNIDGLHKSILDLDEKKYFLSNDAKNRLLNPPLSPLFKFCKQILPIQQPSLPFYRHNGFLFNNEDRSTNWLNMQLVTPELSAHEAYVKGPGTYMVRDDMMVIAPASPISALDLINHFGTPLKDLQEKVVTIGYKECLNILKATLTSTSALTIGLSHLLP